jgi:putative holliday junction resolvase
MPPTIAALGLDIGRKRVGVAGCDGLGLMATGLTTVVRSYFAAELAEFQQIVADRQITQLVAGLPYRMDGTIGPQAKETRNYGKRLAKALGLPLEFVDERLTSVAAEELMQAAGQSVIRNKALIDRKAAAIILQQWLDDHRSSPQNPHDCRNGRPDRAAQR